MKKKIILTVLLGAFLVIGIYFFIPRFSSLLEWTIYFINDKNSINYEYTPTLEYMIIGFIYLIFIAVAEFFGTREIIRIWKKEIVSVKYTKEQWLEEKKQKEEEREQKKIKKLEKKLENLKNK